MSSETPKQDSPPVPAAPAAETPLAKLTARLPEMKKLAEHGEMWGVELASDASAAAAAPTQVVLQKFLRANADDVAAAERQLTEALKWRRKMQPRALVSEVFDEAKFGDLGYVTTHKSEKGDGETVITWNIYGAVKDNQATFGNVEEFIKWRVALMELGIQKLHLNDITKPLSSDGEDPHKMIQVHDYLSVSFFRMDPAVKAASRETIQTFSMAYPELLAHKYFVNVPAIMGWMYGAMKLFLAPATLRKFHPMASGTTLATELEEIVGSLPKEYGGRGVSVKEGETVRLGAKTEEEGAAAAAAEESVEGAKGREETKTTGSEEAEDVTKATEQLKLADDKGVKTEAKTDDVVAKQSSGEDATLTVAEDAPVAVEGKKTEPVDKPTAA